MNALDWYVLAGRAISAQSGEIFTAEFEFKPFGIVHRVPLWLLALATPEPFGPMAVQGREAAAALERLLVGRELQIAVRRDSYVSSLLRASVTIVQPDGSPLDASAAMIVGGFAKPWNDGHPRPVFDPTEPYPLPPTYPAPPAT